MPDDGEVVDHAVVKPTMPTLPENVWQDQLTSYRQRVLKSKADDFFKVTEDQR